MTTSLKQIIPLSLALLTLVSYQFIGAAWTTAPANPPATNALAPINVGVNSASNQALNGGLAADSLAASNGLAVGVYNTATTPNSLTAWRVMRNDGTGNFLTYINTTGGNSATLETDGFAHRERYNPGNGQYVFSASGNGSAGTPITWTESFKILPGGRVGASQYCDISGNNCTTSVGGGLNLGDALPPPPSTAVRNNLCTSAWSYTPGLQTNELATTPGVDVGAHNNEMVVRYSYADRGTSCIEARCTLGHDGNDYFAIGAYSDDGSCGP